MAEGQRMTSAREAVEELMRCEHVDVLREGVALIVRELMEAEVAAQVGAELGERAPDARSAQRNGYRQRGWDTRVGARSSWRSRSCVRGRISRRFCSRRRAEQALVAVVQEA